MVASATWAGTEIIVQVSEVFLFQGRIIRKFGPWSSVLISDCIIYNVPAPW